MKKAKILRTEIWNGITITHVSSTRKIPSDHALLKKARLLEILDKMPADTRDKILNGNL